MPVTVAWLTNSSVCLPVGFISSREGMRNGQAGLAGEAAARSSDGGRLGLWSSNTASCCEKNTWDPQFCWTVVQVASQSRLRQNECWCKFYDANISFSAQNLKWYCVWNDLNPLFNVFSYEVLNWSADTKKVLTMSTSCWEDKLSALSSNSFLSPTWPHMNTWRWLFEGGNCQSLTLLSNISGLWC